MQTFDYSPRFRMTQPFDRIWDQLHTAVHFDQSEFPEYDLLKTDEDNYCIVLAVPGFRQSEISMETRDRALWVSGRKEVDVNHNQYLFRGIPERQFNRCFQLPEHVNVTGARLEAGLLTIDMVRDIPEELQPRKIEIMVDEKPVLKEAIKAA